jgi:hypothetical protein
MAEVRKGYVTVLATRHGHTPQYTRCSTSTLASAVPQRQAATAAENHRRATLQIYDTSTAASQSTTHRACQTAASLCGAAATGKWCSTGVARRATQWRVLAG